MCFNGATSSRTWKLLRLYTPPQTRVASMEPRPHERGNDAQARGADVLRQALQWSHVLTNGETRTKVSKSPFASSFNGATSSRTWKHVTFVPIAVAETQLQWSHVLTNVETPLGWVDFGSMTRVSREPWPHGRGNQLREDVTAMG